MTGIAFRIDLSSFDRLGQRVGAMQAAVPRALSLGLNEGGEKVRTQVQRALKQQTNVKAYSSIIKRMRTVKAGPGSLTYAIVATGKGIPIKEFPVLMQTEVVTVVVGGQEYRSWRSVNVRGSVKEAARSIKLVVAAEFGAADVAQVFEDQTPIAAYAGSDLIFTGYVDDLQPEMGPDGPSTITVSGRSKAADAIDCSADHTKPDSVDKTLLQIAQDQDVFGIGFTSDTPFDPIDRHRFTPGESLFGGLELLARDHGVTMAGQADGSVKFTTAGKSPPRQPGYLLEGLNIKRGSSSHNSANPPIGSEGLALVSGGRSDRMQILGLEHPDSRPTGLPSGTKVLYDASGNCIRAYGQDGIQVEAKSGDIFVKPAAGKKLYHGGDGKDGTYAPVMTSQGPSSNVLAKVG